MSASVCRICLRCVSISSEKNKKTLVKFLYELCESNIEENPPAAFCLLCEFQLLKFHNFRQKCRRANHVFRTWKEANVQESLDNIYKQIPHSLGYLNKNASESMEFIHLDIEPTDAVKIETEDLTKTEAIFIDVIESNVETSHTGAEKDGKSNVTEINNVSSDETELSLKIEDSCDSNDIDIDYEPEKIVKTKKTKIKKSKSKAKTKNKNRTKAKESFGEEIESKRKKFSENQSKLKDRILELLRSGELNDLVNNVKITEELFLKMFEKSDKTGFRSMLPLKPGSSEERQRLKKFLSHLLKKNNPEYDDIFHIELLDTEQKKLDEFNRRRLSDEYTQAEFKCGKCYRVFEAQRLLEYHNRWHEPSVGADSCALCGMRFATRRALAQHAKTNHERVFRCKLCPLYTYNSAVMVNHYNQHKGMEYSCPVCLSVFSNKNTLNNHRRQAHRTSHICPWCARSFVSDKGLYFHTRLKHKDEITSKPDVTVSCDKCDAAFSSRAVLAAHVRQTHAQTQTIHKCFRCKEIFTSLEELKKHKIEMDHQRPNKPTRDHTSPSEDKPTCEECGKAFNSRKSYLRHVNTTHKLNRIHKCGFCSAKFTSAAELAAHRTELSHHRKTRYVKRPDRKQTTKKQLKCDPDTPFVKCQLCSCPVKAGGTGGMYRHFLSMHPDTPYAAVYAQPHYRHLCDQCGKTFKDLTFFLDHANTHTGSRPFACACGRAFAARRHLRLHAARHDAPRHRCNHCGKMFHGAANLFAHRRRHIGDRRFKCEICTKGFLDQAALNEHVRGVHNHIRRTRRPRDK